MGNVGATLAFNLASKNICSSILLKDIRNNIVQAMALDVSQSAKAAKSNTKIYPISKNEDFKDCDIVVITAGIARRPGMSRDDLLLINAKIMTTVVKDVIKYNPNAIIIVVSNPLDAMVYVALKASNYARNKIIGMAGILDSARMKHFIAEKIEGEENKIEASVMGGHGDDMIPLINYSTVNGKTLDKVFNKEDIEDIIDKTRNGGAQIVKLLETGSAYYAPAYSTSLMIEAILNDTKETYPCAVMLEGEYDSEDVVSGVPIILGKNGAEKVIELELNENQKKEFKKSISSVQGLLDTLEKRFFNTTL